MGSGPNFSRVKENPREELLSTDLNRQAKVASRDVQDESMYASAGDRSDGIPGSGGPISGLSRLETPIGNVGALTATVPPGRGFFYDPAYPGLDADDSAFLVLRWVSQTLAFATPSGGNARIDLIVATPGMVDDPASLQSRNILVDPTTNAFAPQSVFKTTDPVSTLSIVQGTPAAEPLAPVVPDHSIAVFEVYVPQSSTQASDFTFVPRLWRKTAFPGSAFHGPLTGCLLEWGVGDPATTTVGMTLSSAYRNRCFIDGELIDLGTTSPALFQDAGANNPFASAAPALNSRAYFVYLCGGRNLPQAAKGYATPGSFTSRTGSFTPAVLVESTVPPDASGFPTAFITTPRGNTIRGACFVGIGFVFTNTSNRASCLMGERDTICQRAVETVVPGVDFVSLASAPGVTIAHVKRAIVGVLTATGSGSSGTSSIAVNSLIQGAPLVGPSSQAYFTVTNPGAPGTCGGAFRVLDGGNLIGLTFLRSAMNLPAININGYSHNVKRVQAL